MNGSPSEAIVPVRRIRKLRVQNQVGVPPHLITLTGAGITPGYVVEIARPHNIVEIQQRLRRQKRQVIDGRLNQVQEGRRPGRGPGVLYDRRIAS